MEFLSDIPWTPVLIATVLSFLLAWVWYSPLLFFSLWKKSMRQAPEDSNPGILVMINGFVAMMITVIAFAAVVSYGEADSFTDYLAIALVIWFGFPLMGAVGAVLWTDYRPSYIFVEGGYSFLSLVITSIVLAWGL